MATKLNQLIAVCNTRKSQSQSNLTKLYQIAQKSALFEGLERYYQAKEDGAETFPPESKRVIQNITDLINKLYDPWVNMFDVVLSQDVGNATARGNIVVDDETILENIPATTMIFIEKQLQDIYTFISKLPTLDPSEEWNHNEDQKLYVSTEVTTHKTKKIQKPIVLYDATDKHPAQCEMVTEDIVTGYWKQKKLSGAISPAKKDHLLKRVTVLKEEVVKARERANSIEVENIKTGQKVLDFIFRKESV